MGFAIRQSEFEPWTTYRLVRCKIMASSSLGLFPYVWHGDSGIISVVLKIKCDNSCSNDEEQCLTYTQHALNVSLLQSHNALWYTKHNFTCFSEPNQEDKWVKHKQVEIDPEWVWRREAGLLPISSRVKCSFATVPGSSSPQTHSSAGGPSLLVSLIKPYSSVYFRSPFRPPLRGQAST